MTVGCTHKLVRMRANRAHASFGYMCVFMPSCLCLPASVSVSALGMGVEMP